MTLLYEYRCRGACGRTLTLDAEEKAAADERRRRGELSLCPTCPGSLRRVWAASVQTVSVPGFHAHERSKQAG
jgi:hypothetical protein